VAALSLVQEKPVSGFFFPLPSSDVQKHVGDEFMFLKKCVNTTQGKQDMAVWPHLDLWFVALVFGLESRTKAKLCIRTMTRGVWNVQGLEIVRSGHWPESAGEE
jgi:hypothetical protein